MQPARTHPPPFAHMHIITEGGRERRRESLSETPLSGGDSNLNRKTASVKTRKTLLQGRNFPLNKQRR